MAGTDVICQAKSGMGKTAVFVISLLNQMKHVDNQISCVVVCHARELAEQISKEFDRFAGHLDPVVRCGVFFGGTKIDNDIHQLHNPPVRTLLYMALIGNVNFSLSYYYNI